ncbi:hypothetical protein HYZ99_00145 [Candidatus Peregrinibacteria bacterium]|nr:hypothetical protein [Candidatus Peregrinibacteria bacterium]
MGSRFGHMTDDHWLIHNLQREVQAVEPTLIVQKQNGLLLPDRIILGAMLHVPMQKKLIVEGTGDELYASPLRIEHVCRVTLNTALQPELEMDEMNLEVAPLIAKLQTHLFGNLQSLLSEKAA